ncbi:MAG TPA: alkaline phosphatase family protein [Terriglobales bacterium]|jgi:phospholipase C|nr:alkaline phosphatase family protein [Terriglobales bacterium]
MKLAAQGLLLFWLASTTVVHAQISKFQHVVVIFQENRTPDNLFQGLCVPPYGKSSSCSTTPSSTQYNIQTSNWLDNKSPGGTIQPATVPLAGPYDLGHSHSDWVGMCDLSAGDCKMDGASLVKCGPAKACPSNPQFRYVDNSQGIVNPYLEMATQYGWANYMFQTNQGPSFPAHQFIFGGTSAPTALDDSKAIFASENMQNSGIGGLKAVAGCTALDGSGGTSSTTVALIQPPGTETKSVYPCFEHETMADLFPPKVTWKYYAPSAGSIWTAPNAIQHICMSSGPGGKCTGPEWTNNVDLTPADVLEDIANCNLRSVNWVIPTGQNSDHANDNDGGGPSWVAAVVNAIGNNTTCETTGYWKNTAIFITWDDWGGWYDHEPPTILTGNQGDYQFGFRVPLIVVSAYTPKGHINNARHNFGSILRFIQHNFGIEEGALNFVDERTTTDLTGFFELKTPPRAFLEISAPKKAEFFLKDKRPATEPDNDVEP